MFILVTVIVFSLKKKKKKKKKTQKLCHNCLTIYLFSWEREGNPYTSNPIKQFKILQVCLLTDPYNAPV